MNEFWNYVKEYCTPQTITVITTLILFLVAILKLISMVKTLESQKSMTLGNLLTALKENNAVEIKKNIIEVVQPIVQELADIKPYLITFTKVLALSQENTPESRVAILELIEQMGKQDNSALIEIAKEVINTQVEDDKKKKEEQGKKLDAIISRPVE
jgi:hypothetical protein